MVGYNQISRFSFYEIFTRIAPPLHDSPAYRLYYVFVLLQRPVSIYTKRIFRGVSSHLETQLRDNSSNLLKYRLPFMIVEKLYFSRLFFSE